MTNDMSQLFTIAQNDVNGLTQLLVIIIYLALLIFWIVGMWKLYEKADQPGWAVLVPIYNFIILLAIAGRPIWWIVLLFIPLVNIVVMIIVSIDIAKAFGKSAIFGLGLAFLGAIMYPALGLSSAQYQGVPNEG